MAYEHSASPTRSELTPGAGIDPRSNALFLAAVHAALASMDPGAVPTAMLVMSAQPAATDTLTIGGDVYEFVATAGAVAADTNIAVEIGAAAANTLANLVAAINAANGLDNEHDNITLIDTVTPALANGTEALLADIVGTSLRIRTADEAGGTVIGANPSIVLAEAITDAADVWLEGNVNLNTLGGVAPGGQPSAVQEKIVNAAMIANTGRFSFPFAVTRFTTEVRTSAGVIRGIADAGGAEILSADAFTLDNGDVLFTSGGAASPNAQATDIVTVTAWA